MAVLRRWMILAAAVAAAAPLHAQSGDPAQIEQGRRYTQWLYEGQVDSLWARFSPEMRQALPSAAALEQMRMQIHGQTGDETEVLSERILDPSPEPPYVVYVRAAHFANLPSTRINVTVVTDPAGTIYGLSVRPAQAAAPPE